MTETPKTTLVDKAALDVDADMRVIKSVLMSLIGCRIRIRHASFDPGTSSDRPRSGAKHPAMIRYAGMKSTVAFLAFSPMLYCSASCAAAPLCSFGFALRPTYSTNQSAFYTSVSRQL